MGILTRALRNITRRKVRALLVIIALSISLSIMVSIPAGLLANEQSTSQMANNLANTINMTSESINDTLSQIDVTMSPNFGGFGFQADIRLPSDEIPNGGNMPGEGSGSYNENGGFPDRFGGFGGGDISGMFGGPQGSANPMNASLYTDIAEINGVAAVEEILEASEGSSNQTTTFMGREFTTQITDYTINGVPLTSDLISNYGILPTTIIEGRNLQAAESGVVLLTQNNSAFFNAGVGDTIKILNATFTVVGVYEPTSNENQITLYMNLSDAQFITNNTGYITRLKVFTTNVDVVDTVANEIKALHSELSVTTQQSTLERLQQQQEMYESALAQSQESIATTQATATQEIIVVVAASSLIVLFVMLYTVRERTKEIGTLKAIGFSNHVVMGQFLVEGLLLSTIAGIVAIAIASVAAPTLSSVLLPTVGRTMGFNNIANFGTNTVTLSIDLILGALGGAMLLGIIGSLYPAWRAAKIRPAEAMKYE
ncbi:MAG: FtsX-like permease family protein [Candidatus Bathyarchaeota archaeon]|nr:FtsX-like permease family protein [Candidatus Bathyarchaeota archaeon]